MQTEPTILSTKTHRQCDLSLPGGTNLRVWFHSGASVVCIIDTTGRRLPKVSSWMRNLSSLQGLVSDAAPRLASREGSQILQHFRFSVIRRFQVHESQATDFWHRQANERSVAFIRGQDRQGIVRCEIGEGRTLRRFRDRYRVLRSTRNDPIPACAYQLVPDVLPEVL